MEYEISPKKRRKKKKKKEKEKEKEKKKKQKTIPTHVVKITSEISSASA